MSSPSTSLWLADRGRHFLVPDDDDLPPGHLTLRTAAGREQSVNEAAVLPYEVSKAEAKAWADEQLRATLEKLRGKTFDFVSQLKARTDEMREENRRTWEGGVEGAPPELRQAVDHIRCRLRDLGQALQRAAQDHGAGRASDEPPDPPPEKDPPS